MDDLLVDARSGVLTSLELHIRSDMPTGWVGWAARVADTRNFGGSGSLFRADPYGFGASIRDDAAARGAATGEAVERYCGNVVPEDLVRGSASALELAGSRVVDPAEFALYSEDQYRLPGFPFVPFTSDLNIRWVLGHTMDEKVPTYVPAALTYLGYYTGARRGEPPIASVAVRRNRRGTLTRRGRDVQLCWNFSNAMPQRCGGAGTGHSRRSSFPTGSGCLRTAYSGIWRARPGAFECCCFPSPFGIPVAAVWIRDDRRGLVALGTAWSTDDGGGRLEGTGRGVCRTCHHDRPRRPRRADLAQRGGRNAAGAPVQTLFGPTVVTGTSSIPQWKDIVDLPTVAQLYLDPVMALAAEEQSLRLHRNTLGIRDSRRSAVGSGFSRSASDVTGTPADFRRSHHRRHLDCRVARRPHPDSRPVQQRPGSLSPSWR